MTHFTVSFWENETAPVPLATVLIVAKMPLGALVFAMQQTGRTSAGYVTVQTGDLITEFYHVTLTGRAITYDRAVSETPSAESSQG